MAEILTASENTITYHNALCFSPQNFAWALFSVSLGAILTPKRNWRQCLCKIWGDKQRALWYVMVFLEWSISQKSGFQSRQAWNFFRISFYKCISCVFNCDDLRIYFFTLSVQMYETHLFIILRPGQYLTHAHNHITRTVAAMDSCLAVHLLAWPDRGLVYVCPLL